MPNLILIYIILLITIILTAALVILNRHTAEENQDTSYTYLDAFGFSEFNLFNDDKGKHY